LLTVEQGERFAVAVLGGEFREPDDVRKNHRARGRFAHRSTTWMFPLSVFTLISPSAPSGHSHWTTPLSAFSRVAGRAPRGTLTLTEPDNALTSRRPGPTRPTSTLPLPAFTLAPSTSSASTVPEPLARSASPECATLMRPLPVLRRHSPAHSVTANEPDPVRASSCSTWSTRTLPLPTVTRACPSRPRSSTLPELAPTITSLPAGQRTSTDPDLAFTSISLSSFTLASRAPVTTTSPRSSPVTLTLPERAVTRMTAPGRDWSVRSDAIDASCRPSETAAR